MSMIIKVQRPSGAGPTSREEWLELRKATLGASEVAGLFGVGRIVTVRPEIKITENSIHLPPMERGTFFEPKAFELLGMLRRDDDHDGADDPGM